MPTIRVGDEGLPTLGVYCPECGWDCSGVAIEADHMSAQVYCNLCEAVSHPGELVEERTDGQDALWALLDEQAEQLDEARTRLLESRRQVAMLRAAAVASRMPEEVSRG
jgi:hypothetical protein